MSITINFTFEKKHFLIMGIIIALPFLFIAISQIMAVPAGGQYHPLSELFIDSNIDMQSKNITNVGAVKSTEYCDSNGLNCKNVSAGWGEGSNLKILSVPSATSCENHCQNIGKHCVGAWLLGINNWGNCWNSDGIAPWSCTGVRGGSANSCMQCFCQ